MSSQWWLAKFQTDGLRLGDFPQNPGEIHSPVMEGKQTMRATEQIAIDLGGEQINFPLEILEKYNQPGPRYTSYPTAPEWTEDFGEAEWLAATIRSALRLSPS